MEAKPQSEDHTQDSIGSMLLKIFFLYLFFKQNPLLQLEVFQLSLLIPDRSELDFKLKQRILFEKKIQEENFQ
jgi:hypothetical protein